MEIDGVVAQQLRFLDLLLEEPISVQVDERAADEVFAGMVRVPRVGLFVLQKALTFTRRHNRTKRYKDLFYIFDLADQTRNLLTTIDEDVRGWAERRGSGWLGNAAAALQEECGAPDADAIGRVLDQIPVEQRPPRRYLSRTFTELVRILDQSRSESLSR